jgi:linoleate 10R-lipoxygenase
MVANQAQVFGQVIDYYLSSEGCVHLPEIHRIAKQDSPEADEILLHYLLEGVRLNGTFGAYRRAAKNVTINEYGKPLHIGEGRNTFVSFVSLLPFSFCLVQNLPNASLDESTDALQLQIARDPAIYPDPHTVRLDRPIDSYIVYGIGTHACLGGQASRVALTAMFKTVMRLENLRRATGPQGQMKKIPREGGFYAYMDAKESTYWPFPTTCKVWFDGEVGEWKGKANGY